MQILSAFAPCRELRSRPLALRASAPGASHQAMASTFRAASRRFARYAPFGPKGPKDIRHQTSFGPSGQKRFARAGASHLPAASTFLPPSAANLCFAPGFPPALLARVHQVPSAPGCGKHLLRRFARYALFWPFRPKGLYVCCLLSLRLKRRRPSAGTQVASRPAYSKHFLCFVATSSRTPPFRAKARKDVRRLTSFLTKNPSQAPSAPGGSRPERSRVLGVLAEFRGPKTPDFGTRLRRPLFWEGFLGPFWGQNPCFWGFGQKTRLATASALRAFAAFSHFVRKASTALALAPSAPDFCASRKNGLKTAGVKAASRPFDRPRFAGPNSRGLWGQSTFGPFQGQKSLRVWGRPSI